MRKLWFFFVVCVALIFGILFTVVFPWAGMNGSGFEAAVLRGVSRLTYAVQSQPKADIILPVQFDKQDQSLSCEAATLKMALAYRGKKVSEKELLKKIGFDFTPKSISNGKTIWGDPQKGFVGKVDGKMLVNGYGVYWHPIAAAANAYNQYAVAFENGEITDLTRELQAGNPIIVWGYLGSGKPASWETPQGKFIRAVSYEHTFVVRGFAGSPEDPLGFFVIDPIYGYVYFSKEIFLKKWDAFSRSGVIVY